MACKTAGFLLHSSAVWRIGSERRFYDYHDRKVNGSTTNLVSLLRPWIRCFTMVISAWWNLASSKLKKSQENLTGKTWKQRLLLSESGFVLRKAPPPFSRDRRIKMKKSNNQSISVHLPCIHLLHSVQHTALDTTLVPHIPRGLILLSAIAFSVGLLLTIILVLPIFTFNSLPSNALLHLWKLALKSSIFSLIRVQNVMQ